MPFRGETAIGYVNGLTLRYIQDLVTERLGPNAVSNVYLGGLKIENRFRYNQGFKSIFSMVPSVIVMMLVLIPAIMATIAVVREKETGSIANFRSTPVSKFEFLMGKQVPYVVVGMITFTLLVLMAFFRLQRAGQRSFGTLSFATLLYVFSNLRLRSTGLHLYADTGSGGFCDHRARIIPTVNFSGLLVPVSSLTGQGRIIGLMFPAAGTSRSPLAPSPRLGFSDLWFNTLVLAAFTNRLPHSRAYIAAEAGELRCRWRARQQTQENGRRRMQRRSRSVRGVTGSPRFGGAWAIFTS